MKNNTTQPVIFVALHRNTDPKAPISQMFPANITIPTTAWIDDPERGNVLIQYIKGEKSIYAYTGGLDKNGNPLVEQTKDAKPKKELILMSKGSISCDPREKTLIEFLEKSFCEGSKLIEGSAIYRKRDVVKTAEKELEKIYADNDLMNQVRSMTAIELATLSFCMGDKNAFNEDATTNRWNLIVAAKNIPEKLREKIDNPKTARKAKISLAEFENLIVIDKTGREVRWTSGNKITTVPIGMDALDYMVDMSFQPEYAEVYKTICDKLNPEIKEKQEVSDPVPDQKTPELEFVENCLNTGILERKGTWYSVKGTPKGDPYRNFHQGTKNTVVEYLKLNPELNKYLQDKILAVEV